MLSREERVIAERLAAVCDVPIKFAELVIESETAVNDEWSIDMKMKQYKADIDFLDKVARTDSPVDQQMEFYAQCLALANDVPIEMARIVIKSESGDNLDEENETTTRNQRLNFLLKVFAFLQNNPNFHL